MITCEVVDDSEQAEAERGHQHSRAGGSIRIRWHPHGVEHQEDALHPDYSDHRKESGANRYV